MSMGAACFGEIAGPRPRPPRPPTGGGWADGLKGTWAWRLRTQERIRAQAEGLLHKVIQLFNRVTGFVAPPESVRLPVQSFQRAPVVRGRARRVDGHHHFIPHLQGVALDSLLAQ